MRHCQGQQRFQDSYHFFKCYINELLEKEERKVTIVYSGGDDVFLVGAWNDVIAACVDLKML